MGQQTESQGAAHKGAGGGVLAPVAWSLDGFIHDEDGRPIGTDETEVRWGSECPDPDEGWRPLYGKPLTQSAPDGAMVEMLRVEKLAAAIVAGMILEAAYLGHTVSAREIAATVEADPNGETAAYFRTSAISALEWIEKFRVNPELLDVFGERQHG